MKLLVLLPLVSAAALVLTGCGETTVEDVRKAYGAMSDEKLQAEALSPIHAAVVANARRLKT